MDILKQEAEESALEGMKLFFEKKYTAGVTPQMTEQAIEEVAALAELGPQQTLEEMTQWSSHIQEIRQHY